MTALFLQVMGDHAVFAADTLFTRGSESGRCSKVLAYPHLSMLVTAAGSAHFRDVFTFHLQNSLMGGERNLHAASAAIRQAWQLFRLSHDSEPRETVIYAAWATHGQIQTVCLQSPDFVPVPLGSYARIAAPAFDNWSIAAGSLREPVDFARMIARQRRKCPEVAIDTRATVARLDADGTITMPPQFYLCQFDAELDTEDVGKLSQVATVTYTASVGEQQAAA